MGNALSLTSGTSAKDELEGEHDPFTPSSFDSDAASTTLSLPKTTTTFHRRNSSQPILITTSNLPEAESPFSNSYDSFPDPASFPRHEREARHTAEASVGHVLATSELLPTSPVITSPSIEGEGQYILASKKRLRENLTKTFEGMRTKKVDGRVWIVSSPPSTARQNREIKMGHPYYGEVVRKAELQREKRILGGRP